MDALSDVLALLLAMLIARTVCGPYDGEIDDDRNERIGKRVNKRIADLTKSAEIEAVDSPTKPPEEYEQYIILAIKGPGDYIDYYGRNVYLPRIAEFTYKYGTTKNGEAGRYPNGLCVTQYWTKENKAYMKNRLKYNMQIEGTKNQCELKEKQELWSYYQRHNRKIPPGNARMR